VGWVGRNLNKNKNKIIFRNGKDLYKHNELIPSQQNIHKFSGETDTKSTANKLLTDSLLPAGLEIPEFGTSLGSVVGCIGSPET